MKHIVSTILLLILLSTFSGCYRYINWAICIFDQGEKIDTCVSFANPYIKSVRIYDQFTTLAIFDALWLHEEVVQAFVCAHAEKYGFTHQQYQDFLEQHYQENEPYISFYLLSTIYGNNRVLLTDDDPMWVVQLRIGNTLYKPAKIKLVELPHEYRYFFGKRYTVFKKQYLIQFDAFDKNDHALVGPMARELELIFRRVGYETGMIWCLNSEQRVTDFCPLDRNLLAYDIKTNLY